MYDFEKSVTLSNSSLGTGRKREGARKAWDAAYCRIFQGRVRYGTYRGVPAVYTAGITGTGYFGKFGAASIPVPETSVSSGRHQYRYRRYRYRTEHTLGILCK